MNMVKARTVDVDPDDRQRRQVGRVKRSEALAVHLDSTVATQQFVVEKNRHFGDAIVPGHQQTGDKVVASVAPQVKHWQLKMETTNRPTVRKRRRINIKISLVYRYVDIW